jgi:hypothetical protein
MTNTEIEKDLEKHIETIAKGVETMTKLLIRSYQHLSFYKNQYVTRNTNEGQKLLCDLRDAIAQAKNMSAEDVQNGEAFKEEL